MGCVRATHRGATDKLHDLLLEVKVVSPVSSNPECTGVAGALSAFANTAPNHLRSILGCDARRKLSAF